MEYFVELNITLMRISNTDSLVKHITWVCEAVIGRWGPISHPQTAPINVDTF